MITLKGRIRELEKLFGSLRATASSLGVNAGYLCKLKSGEKLDPSDRFCRKLGLRKRITYEKLGTKERSAAEKPLRR